jgi:hypothetical protein
MFSIVRITANLFDDDLMAKLSTLPSPPAISLRYLARQVTGLTMTIVGRFAVVYCSAM